MAADFFTLGGFSPPPPLATLFLAPGGRPRGLPPLVVAPPDPLLTPLGLGWRGVGVGQLPSEPSSVAVDNRMDLRGGGPPSPLVVASAVADETGVFTIYKILFCLLFDNDLHI